MEKYAGYSENQILKFGVFDDEYFGDPAVNPELHTSEDNIKGKIEAPRGKVHDGVWDELGDLPSGDAGAPGSSFV